MDNERVPGLGDFIRQRRKAMGLTQEALCKELGIEQGYLTQIERNRRIGSPETLLKIGKALGMKPAYKIFALFDTEADLEQEELNVTYLKLPEILSGPDRQLISEIVNRLTQLRALQPVPALSEEEQAAIDLAHNAAIEAKYDQQLEAEAATTRRSNEQEAG